MFLEQVWPYFRCHSPRAVRVLIRRIFADHLESCRLHWLHNIQTTFNQFSTCTLPPALYKFLKRSNDFGPPNTSVNVCCATPIYQEAGKYHKTSKIWQICLILHWYPTWMAAPSNRPIKMVVHIQHLQCLSKDDKDIQGPRRQSNRLVTNVLVPFGEKTNRQGTALMDNHCMH